MASFKKPLSDAELMQQLREFGISSPVTDSTRDILTKKLNHAKSNKKNPSQSKLKSGGARPRAVKSRKSLSTFSSEDEEENIFPAKFFPQNNSKFNPFSNSSKDSSSTSNGQNTMNTSINNSFHSGSTPHNFGNNNSSAFTNNIGHRRDEEIRRNKGTSYVNTNIARVISSIFSEKKKDGRTALDTDVSDSLSNGIGRNVRVNCTPQVANAGYHPSKPLSFVTTTSNSTSSMVDGNLGRSVNKRTYTNFEGFSDSYDNSEWPQSVPLLLIKLLAVFFVLLAFCYVNIHRPLLPILANIPIAIQSAAHSFQEIFHLATLTSLAFLKSSDKASSTLMPLKKIEVDTPNANVFPICSSQSETEICLTRDEMKEVGPVLGKMESLIIPSLIEQHIDYNCRYTSEPYMNRAKFLDVLLHVCDGNEASIMFALEGFIKLVKLNVHWGIQLVKEEDGSVIGLMTEKVPRQYLCHIIHLFYSVAYFIAAGSATAAFCWLVIKINASKKNQMELIKIKVFNMVESILEVLQEWSADQKVIPVNHVRDTLIKPRERDELADVWQKAVSFVEQFDSRVRCESRVIDGEECEVFHWVSNASKKSNSTILDSSIKSQPESLKKTNTLYPELPEVTHEDSPPSEPLTANGTRAPVKAWQGQAFESLEATNNLPKVAPTSCLKIRNMFDSDIECGDDWIWIVQDSLLEKCKDVDIVHMAVDRYSREGCVYLKCVSPLHAGKAYRTLHGWWYDGNLVTVKYLREGRYHERFPSAITSTKPMKPYSRM